ncbi:MAG: class I SAM-dependent methyltransferase [Desulfobacteraceae bacterium]|nr:class I SAM-dependent methyltransferase [Desulfobacteraceae bacterium]
MRWNMRNSCQIYEAPIVSSAIGYDPIASVFDYLMGDDFCNIAFPHLAGTIGYHFSGKKTIKHLDLACGTGTFIERLARLRSTKSTGIDSSQAMIAIAKRKLAQTGAEAKLLKGDVLEKEFPRPVDIVTMNFDALNHLTKAEYWRFLFKKVYDVLADKGLFLFDVNLPERLLEDWDSPEVIIKSSATYVQCALRPRKAKGSVRRKILMLIYSETDGRIEKHFTLVEHLAISKERIFEMLRRSGFSEVQDTTDRVKRRTSHIFLRNRLFVYAVK